MLTGAQLAALKADIAANTATIGGVAINAMANSDNNNAVIADWYNGLASPAYNLWRTGVGRNEVQGSPAFDWTRVDNLSVGKARIWDYMFGVADQIHPNQGNVRTGINAVWVGTQADLDVRAAVLAVCRRGATWAEKLFATATTDGPAQTGARGASTNPDTNAYQDGFRLSGGDVTDARNS